MKFKKSLGERYLGILGLLFLITPFIIIGYYLMLLAGAETTKQLFIFWATYLAMIFLIFGKDLISIITQIFEVE